MTDCIINVGCDGWYEKGSSRLLDSLIHHGYWGHKLISTNPIGPWPTGLPKGAPPHNRNPYAFKVYAFQWAIDNGYTNILWLDSSVWCVRYPKVHLEAMGSDGYYLFHSGFSVAEWTNDRCLNYFGVTREEAADMPMLASGVLGLNMNTEIAREFFAQWKNAMNAGVFKGSWTFKETEGSFPYRGHRHDQSAASIIAYRLGMRQHPHNTHEVYYDPLDPMQKDKMPTDVEFSLMGI